MAERLTIAAKSVQTVIRPCREGDLAGIAEVHQEQFRFKGSLLGRLSPAVIAAFYGAFLDRSTFLVHISDGEVDGFVMGGSLAAIVGCKKSFLCKHGLSCVADIARRPHLWLRSLRSFVKLSLDWMPSMSWAQPPDEFRMLSIAVAQRATRKGVGTALVQGFEAEIRPACCSYGLNVLKTNTLALRFYEKLAFQCVGETAIAWKLRKVLAANAGMPDSRTG